MLKYFTCCFLALMTCFSTIQAQTEVEGLAAEPLPNWVVCLQANYDVILYAVTTEPLSFTTQDPLFISTNTSRLIQNLNKVSYFPNKGIFKLTNAKDYTIVLGFIGENGALQLATLTSRGDIEPNPLSIEPTPNQNFVYVIGQAENLTDLTILQTLVTPADMSTATIDAAFILVFGPKLVP